MAVVRLSSDNRPHGDHLVRICPKGLANVHHPRPRVLAAPSTTGRKAVVLSRSRAASRRQRSDNDAVAVEMEGGGFLEAGDVTEHVRAWSCAGTETFLTTNGRQMCHCTGGLMMG